MAVAPTGVADRTGRLGCPGRVAVATMARAATDQDGSSWVTRFLPSSERRQGGHPFAVIDAIG